MSENKEKNCNNHGWIILTVVIVLAISLLLIEFGATGDSVFMGDLGMMLVALIPLAMVVMLSTILIRIFRTR